MGLYLVESFKGANIFTKLAFIFLLFAMFLGWISYCTNSWGRVTDLNAQVPKYYVGYGIWRTADNIYFNRNPTADRGDNAPLPQIVTADGWLLEWYGGFQACITVGFVCLNLGFFLVILFVFVAPCKSNGDLSFWNAINNILGAVGWLVGVILFGAEFDDSYATRQGSKAVLHYSFYFGIFTALLQLITGILLLLTKRGGGAVRGK